MSEHAPSRRRVTALAVGLFALGLGCSSARSELNVARDRWASAHLTNYRFHYTTSGFVPREDLQIVVRDGRVAAASGRPAFAPPGTNRNLTTAELEYVPTVESLFERIDRSLDGLSEVSVTYDAALGYPAHASFSSGGEGDWFTVTELAADR